MIKLWEISGKFWRKKFSVSLTTALMRYWKFSEGPNGSFVIRLGFENRNNYGNHSKILEKNNL